MTTNRHRAFRFAAVAAIFAAGAGLFFLSTFTFLAIQGQLNQETLVRMPLVGNIFKTDATTSTSEQLLMLTVEVGNLRKELSLIQRDIENREAGVPKAQEANYSKEKLEILERSLESALQTLQGVREGLEK